MYASEVPRSIDVEGKTLRKRNTSTRKKHLKKEAKRLKKNDWIDNYRIRSYKAKVRQSLTGNYKKQKVYVLYVG